MFHFSDFARHLVANRAFIAPAVFADIRREGLARLNERQQAGRAGGALLFDDLIAKIETATAPR